MRLSELPAPACEMGYPVEQLREVFTEIQMEDLEKFMHGQTMCYCDGTRYNHNTGEYEEACEVEHGAVIYQRDVRAYVNHWPVDD